MLKHESDRQSNPNPLTMALQPPGANVQLDAEGEAMPTGMRQRLGSPRFKVANSPQEFVFAGNGDWIWTKSLARVSVMHRETGRFVRQDQLGFGMDSVASIAVSHDRERVAISMWVREEQIDEQPEEVPRRCTYRVVVLSAQTTAILHEIRWKARADDLPCLSLDQNGRTLITGTTWGDLRQWDVESGQILQNQTFLHSALHMSAIAPDGRSMVVVNQGGVFWWKFADNVAPIHLGKREARSVCFAPNGLLFATIGLDGADLWDAITGDHIAHLKSPEVKDYYWSQGGISFTHDSQLLAIPATIVDHVELWDVNLKQRIATLPTPEPAGVAISQDGRWLAVGGHEYVIRIFDLRTRQMLEQPGDRYGKKVYAIRFAGNNTLVTAGLGDARVWEGENHFQVVKQTRILSHEDPTTEIRALAISPDGSLIVTSAADDTLGVWDRRTGQRLLTLSGNAVLGEMLLVHFRPDGRQFMSWGDDAVLRWWDTTNGTLIAAHKLKLPFLGHPAMYPVIDLSLSAAVTSDAAYLFVQIKNKYFEFETSSGKLVQQTPISSGLLAISPDGRWIAAREEEKDWDHDTWLHTIVLYDRATMQVVHIWPVQDPRDALASTANSNQQNESKDVRRGRRYSAYVKENHGAIKFSPDSTRLAWCWFGENNGIDIVDIGKDRLRASIPLESTGTCLEFSPDGTIIASGHEDSTVSLWNQFHPVQH